MSKDNQETDLKKQACSVSAETHCCKGGLNVLDLFSGIGGFSLGLERAGMKTIAFCEIEDFPRKVLAKHWPGVPIFRDIKELKGEDINETVDVICGGYPCQPFSVAGKRTGEKDDRHLWPEMLRLVKEKRPHWVLAENVVGHISMGLDTVLFDLEDEGYATETFIIPACGVTLPHRRDRVWIVAHAERQRCPKPEHEKTRVWHSARCKEEIFKGGVVLEAEPESEWRHGTATNPEGPLRLNPVYVEAMMGYPKGWTDLKHSETL